MPKRGMTHVPNFATERVLAAVAAIPIEEFSPPDIHALVPDLSSVVVSQVLAFKSQQGALTRIRRGYYRKGGTKIRPQRAPLGLISEAVWATLDTDPKRKFMRLAEITGKVESFIGRPGFSAYNSVSTVLSIWYRDGHLERIGKRGEYGYRLREGIAARPVASA